MMIQDRIIYRKATYVNNYLGDFFSNNVTFFNVLYHNIQCTKNA